MLETMGKKRSKIHYVKSGYIRRFQYYTCKDCSCSFKLGAIRKVYSKVILAGKGHAVEKHMLKTQPK
jgi:transposase-like protein